MPGVKAAQTPLALLVLGGYITFVPETHFMKSTYRVIGFGESEYGFWNYPAFCSTIGYAQGFYNAHLNDPEMEGAVLIKVDHESWEVIQEFGTENMSIVCGPLGNFKVERAPKLVML